MEKCCICGERISNNHPTILFHSSATDEDMLICDVCAKHLAVIKSGGTPISERKAIRYFQSALDGIKNRSVKRYLRNAMENCAAGEPGAAQEEKGASNAPADLKKAKATAKKKGRKAHSKRKRPTNRFAELFAFKGAKGKKHRITRIAMILVLVLAIGIPSAWLLHSGLTRRNQNEIEEIALDYLKSHLKNPESLQVHEVQTTKTESGTGYLVFIDYSGMNGFGGYNRDIFTCMIDNNHEVVYGYSSD